MKSFNLYWSNNKVEKLRIIGFSYEKKFLLNELDIQNILIFYFWKWYREFLWKIK